MDLELVSLLNASFSQWNVDARAEGARNLGDLGDLGDMGDMGDTGKLALARVVRVLDGDAQDGELWVLRQAPAPGPANAALETWSLAGDPGGEVMIEEAIRSLSGLLMALRKVFDPSYVPDRAIIGVRPLAAVRTDGLSPSTPVRE